MQKSACMVAKKCMHGCTRVMMGRDFTRKGLEPHVVFVVTIEADGGWRAVTFEDAGNDLLFVGVHGAFSGAHVVVISQAEVVGNLILCCSDVGVGHASDGVAESSGHADGVCLLEVGALCGCGEGCGIDDVDEVSSLSFDVEECLAAEAFVGHGAVVDDAEWECDGWCHSRISIFC